MEQFSQELRKTNSQMEEKIEISERKKRKKIEKNFPSICVE
jgi:hypothetical protein